MFDSFKDIKSSEGGGGLKRDGISFHMIIITAADCLQKNEEVSAWHEESIHYLIIYQVALLILSNNNGL